MRLVDYIFERFPHSKPDSVASVKPRSKYEEFVPTEYLPAE